MLQPKESTEQTQGSIPRWLLPVREIIFGKQNERIEYFMDSYFKLPSEGRTAVVAGAFIVAGLTVFGFIWTLFVRAQQFAVKVGPCRFRL